MKIFTNRLFSSVKRPDKPISRHASSVPSRLRTAAMLGIGSTLFALAMTAFIAVRLESGFYGGLTTIEVRSGLPTTSEQWLILWIIWAKSLCVAFPVLLASAALA